VNPTTTPGRLRDQNGEILDESHWLMQLAAERERAAIVAWLRSRRWSDLHDMRYGNIEWADAIERGEHRRPK
jgi:hypothetical protein